MTKDMSFLALDKLIIFKMLQKLQAHSLGSTSPCEARERERPWLGLVTCVTLQNVTIDVKCNNFLMQNETIFLTRNVTSKMLQP